MEDIMHELAEKWEASEVVEYIKGGDIFITRSGVNAYIVGKCGRYEEVSDNVRVYQRAPVPVPGDVFAIIAEFKDYPGHGRWMFQRSDWDDNVWINLESTTVTLDELTNIRVVKDQGGVPVINTMSDVRNLISDLLDKAERTDKDEILSQVDSLFGEEDYALRLDIGNGFEYRVWYASDGFWSWGWFEADDDVDALGGFPNYRDAVRDIKRDIRENLSVLYADKVRILRVLDKEMYR